MCSSRESPSDVSALPYAAHVLSAGPGPGAQSRDACIWVALHGAVWKPLPTWIVRSGWVAGVGAESPQRDTRKGHGGACV